MLFASLYTQHAEMPKIYNHRLIPQGLYPIIYKNQKLRRILYKRATINVLVYVIEQKYSDTRKVKITTKQNC